MNQGKNLRDCAEYVGVSLKISFYMRHRVMGVYRSSIENIQLFRITEIDETEMYISFSGNHTIHHHKRGGKGLRHKEKTEFTDKIMFLTAVDRNNTLFITIGKVSTTPL